MKKQFSINLLSAAILVVVLPLFTTAQSSASDEFRTMLHEWTKGWINKIPQGYSDTLNFHLKDDDSNYFIVFNSDGYELFEYKNEKAGITLTSDLETYKKIYNGELNAMTAVGRASIRDAAPLDMILENGVTFKDIDWNKGYFTVINFFNKDLNNKALLGREHARKIHGGYAVALYYTPGYRSAWYNIVKGEVLNESGEKDPFNQSFIIISGKGFAKIGDETFEISANQAFYIKPNIEHKVWTDSEEGVTLIWNAWGSEAW